MTILLKCVVALLVHIVAVVAAPAPLILVQGVTVNVMGSLEPGFAALHNFFLLGGNLCLSLDLNEKLWSLYSTLSMIRTTLFAQQDYWKKLHTQISSLQVSAETSAETAASLTLTSSPLEGISPLVNSVESLARMILASYNCMGQLVLLLPSPLCWQLQAIPLCTITFRQELTQLKEEYKALVRQIKDLYHQLAATRRPTQISSSSPSSSSSFSPRHHELTAEESVNADLFVKELSEHGKLIHANGALTEKTGPIIMQQLREASPLPCRIDLTSVTTESVLVWHGLTLVLALPGNVNDLTIPALPPAYLKVLGDSFGKNKLEFGLC